MKQSPPCSSRPHILYTNTMRVLAVDPGYDRFGVAVVEKQNGKEHVLYSGCVETDKNQDIPDRILRIGQVFSDLIKEHQPDLVGMETLFFNKNQTTAIAVAETRGVIMYLCRSARIKLMEFGPQEIKVAVTGYGKSDKTAVIDMTKRLATNVPDKALDDEYDAIAIGITAIAHSR